MKYSFFEVSNLPGILSKFTYINPIYPLVNLTRYAFIGTAGGSMVLQAVIVGCLSVGMFLLATHAIKKGYGVKIR